MMIAYARVINEAEKELDRIELLACKAVKSSRVEELLSSHSKLNKDGHQTDKQKFVSFEYQFIGLAEKVKALTKLGKETVISEEQQNRVAAIHTRWRLLRTQTANSFIRETDVCHDYQLSYPWERCLNDQGVPYYTNHHTKSTQWEHPVLEQLMKSLRDKTQSVYFIAYKIALKLREIQKLLMLDHLHAFDIVSEFKNIRQVDDDGFLSCCQINRALQSLYTPILTSTGRAVLSDLTVNWICRLYDPQRTGSIGVVASQVALVLLSADCAEQKFSQLFELASQETPGELNTLRLTQLLSLIQQLPRDLGDISAFANDTLLENSVQMCLGVASLGIADISNWIHWVSSSPQCLAWIPLISKIKEAEGAVHKVKCVLCKVYPIVGFLYSCTECLFHNVCQTCFLMGLNYRVHDPSHSIAEYCGQMSQFTLFRQHLHNKFRGFLINNNNNNTEFHRKIATSSPGSPVNSSYTFGALRNEQRNSLPKSLSPSGSKQRPASSHLSNGVSSKSPFHHISVMPQISLAGSKSSQHSSPSPTLTGVDSNLSDVERRMELLEKQNHQLMVQLDTLREIVGQTPISSGCSSTDGDQVSSPTLALGQQTCPPTTDTQTKQISVPDISTEV